ncbi:MAG: glycosyltransferase [Lentisphaerae bacterium]|nr:glycosyltransferase [Lentisphaerota bacterium]
MTSTPWLSVIVPTYQGAQFLGDTLESIACQWSDDIEVIAIDDGSTDATREILDHYGSRIGVRVLAHTRTGNWVRNTNRALSEARGEYLCMLHQDDLWLPQRLASLRKAAAHHPNVGLFLNPSWFIDNAGRPVGRWRVPLPVGQPLEPSSVLMHLVVQNFIALPAPMFKRDGWRDAGPMDDTLWFLADWKLWGALAARTRTLVLPDLHTAFRVHRASQTAQRSHDANDLRQQYVDVIASMGAQLEEGHKKQQALAAAELNTDASIALALWSHGDRASGLREFMRHPQLRPGVWHQFWRDSRMVERVAARLRIGLHTGTKQPRGDRHAS